MPKKAVDADLLYMQAMHIYENGDFKTAFRLFMEIAVQGHTHERNMIGNMYDTGQGVSKDVVQARYWYRRAWRTGKPRYMCSNIASSYANSGNRRRALYWWNKAIALDDGDAALELAKFLNKSGEARYCNRILNLLRMAVESHTSGDITPAGHEEAQQLLSDKLKVSCREGTTS